MTLSCRRLCFSASCRGKREPCWSAVLFYFCCQTLCCGWIQKRSQQPPRAPYLCQAHFCLCSSQGFLFPSPHPALSSWLQLSSAQSLCLSHSRCGHGWHVFSVALHVPGGVADGACGPGGVACELRDLLQGEGDRLQGERHEAGGRSGFGLPSKVLMHQHVMKGIAQLHASV